MAPRNTNPAAPAVLMGSALLAAIAAATVTRITQEQAASLDDTHYTVNTNDVQDGAALVTLTEAGVAAAAAVPADEPAAATAKADIGIDEDVPMPEGKTRRTGDPLYPFDKLEKVGASFHVPKTAENPDPGTRLSSSVSGARVRYSELMTDAEGKPVMEEYKRPTYQTDAEGKLVLDAEGKRITTGSETKTRQKRTTPTRDFKVMTVGADDPRGEGARCFRVK